MDLHGGRLADGAPPLTFMCPSHLYSLLRLARTCIPFGRASYARPTCSHIPPVSLLRLHSLNIAFVSRTACDVLAVLGGLSAGSSLTDLCFDFDVPVANLCGLAIFIRYSGASLTRSSFKFRLRPDHPRAVTRVPELLDCLRLSPNLESLTPSTNVLSRDFLLAFSACGPPQQILCRPLTSITLTGDLPTSNMNIQLLLCGLSSRWDSLLEIICHEVPIALLSAFFGIGFTVSRLDMDYIIITIPTLPGRRSLPFSDTHCIYPDKRQLVDNR